VVSFSTPEEPESLPEIESGGNRFNELAKKQMPDLHTGLCADHPTGWMLHSGRPVGRYSHGMLWSLLPDILVTDIPADLGGGLAERCCWS
jgi:hypothetical protein